MRLFVTGGAGFIGSNYVRHVLDNSDDTVVVYDALTYAGNLASIEPLLGSRVKFVWGDITDSESVRQEMANCNQVVHFAAESHVDRSIYGPDAFVRTNCDGTAVLCEEARHLDIDKFIHISTDEVYGSVEWNSSKETDTLAPRSPYSASKAGSDLIALSFFHTHGLPVVVTRASNNYGPYQFPEKIIPFFTTNLLDGKKIPLYGDGLNVRDWIHVDDHCYGIETVRHKGGVGEIYNIGGGTEITNRELTLRLLALCGSDSSAIEYVEDRLGHDRRYSLDCGKLHQLGWSPRHKFVSGLAQTVEWYKLNRQWWQPLKEK